MRENELKLLNDFKEQKESIQIQFECGIISLADALEEKSKIMKKEIKLKEKLVKEVHITKDGKPRTISYLESVEMYSTKMADGRKMRATTYENLILKLFNEYHLSISSFTVNDIFEKALELKRETKNVNPDTLRHNRSTYNRFIDNDFRKLDVREITEEVLQKYTLNLVRNNRIKDKAFLNYKGILNLIFNYAVKKKVIPDSPVRFLENQEYMKSCDNSSGTSETKIFSEEELEIIKKTIRHKMKFKRYNGYFINGYAMLFSIQTGMRVGEICSLKWDDILEDRIHIHSQQLHSITNQEYTYACWTKDEKGRSNGGRYFPLTNEIKALLQELKEVQNSLEIHSEYVFCHEDGEWIKKEAYQTSLRRLCRGLGYSITNNHAFRMSLNSNVLIPSGMTSAMRAELLGHSIMTNEKYYSFARKDNVEMALNMLNHEVTPRSPQNIVYFEKRKTLETAISKVLG